MNNINYNIMNMNDNTKLEIAIEIMAQKIAKTLFDEEVSEEIYILLNEREQMYLGNEEIINKILNVYVNDIKFIKGVENE